MNVIEQFVEGKLPDQSKCEDGIFVNDHFAVVVDGSTSKSDFLWNGKPSGLIAKEFILTALETIRPDISAEDMMLSLNHVIRRWYEEYNMLNRMEVNACDRCTAGGLVIYSNSFREVWFVGDCKAMIDGTPYDNDKFVDELFNELRSFYLESELLEGKTIQDLIKHDTGRDLIIPIINKRQTKFQNLKAGNKFVYPVIDGYFYDISSIKKVTVPQDAKEIILASDGYPKLFPSLTESEAHLKSLLLEDPLLFRKFKSTKGIMPGNNSFDDRAYIRFAP